MKKIIVLLIVTLRMFLVFPINVSNTTSIDEETGETIITRIYENEEDGLVKKIMWMKSVPVLKYMEDFSVVRYMEEYYGEGNSDGFTISKTYNYNLNTKSYDRMETYYREDSNRIVCCTIPELVNGKVRYVATIEYKPMNTENIDKEVCVLSEDRKPLCKTIYYNENCIKTCVYIEYQGNDKYPVYIRQDIRDNSDCIKTYETFYSFPNYNFDDNKPYKEIYTFFNRSDGIIKKIVTQNGDGTFLDEIIADPQKGKESYTRAITKCRSDGIDLYTEEYYDEKLYAGKAWKVVTWWNEIEGIDKISYYDKEGNEIPESEIGFPETQ